MFTSAPHTEYCLSREDWVAVAVFIEAEGCIYVDDTHGKKPRVSVQATQKRAPRIYWLLDRLPGSRIHFKPQDQMWYWILSRHKAVLDLLDHIEPLLLSKREEAQHAQELLVMLYELDFPVDCQNVEHACRRIRSLKHDFEFFDL